MNYISRKTLKENQVLKVTQGSIVSYYEILEILSSRITVKLLKACFENSVLNNFHGSSYFWIGIEYPNQSFSVLDMDVVQFKLMHLND